MNVERTEKKPTKVGLVLAGGGAKGAYTFGALQALHDHKIKFDAVSGTSVGALNAALWSSGSLKTGERLYSNLSFATTYAPSPLIRRLPKPLAWGVSVGVFILSVVISNVFGKLTPSSSLNRLSAAFLSTIVWSPLVGASIYIYATLGAPLQLPEKEQGWVLYIQFGTLVAWLRTYHCLRKGIRSEEHLMLIVNAYAFWFVGTFFVAALLLGVGLVVELDLGTLGALIVVPLIFGVLVLAVWAFMACISFVVSRLESSLSQIEDKTTALDSGPLKCEIEKIARRKFRGPTFACFATSQENLADDFDFEAEERYRKERLHWVPSRGPKPKSPNKPPQREWCSRYIRIDSEKPAKRTAALLASAALPFGIVPVVEYEGERCVDGGVVDNVPIPPVAHLVDEVLVILLEAHKSRESAIRECNVLTLDGRYYPEKGLSSSLACLHIFHPKKSLGGFLSGTLRFKPRYSQELMKRGYREMVDALQNELSPLLRQSAEAS